MPPIVKAMLGAALLVAVTVVVAGDLLTFVNVPALVIVIGITALTQFVSFGPRTAIRAFLKPAKPDSSTQELAQRLRIFQGARVQCLGAGFLGGVLMALAGLSRLDSVGNLGPIFAGCLVCIFYALAIRVFVLIPLEQQAIQQLDRNLLPAASSA